MTVHPLLHRDTSTDTSTSYASTFSGDEHFFRDHRVHRQRIFPGAAYVEMARAAVVARHALQDEHVVRIQNLAWMRPLVADGTPVELHVRVARPNTDGPLTFEFHDGKEEGAALRGVYCRGIARVAVAEPGRLGSHDLHATLARCTSPTSSVAHHYERLERLGFEYGPAHRGLAALHVAPDLVVARLALPDSLRTDAARYALHPSLLDAALQASIALPESRIDDSGSAAALPFWVREVSISSRAGEVEWAVIRHGADRPERPGQPTRALHLDIDLCDADGEVLARLEGYTAKTMRTSGVGRPSPSESPPQPSVAPPPGPGSRPLLKRLRGAEGDRTVHCIAAGGTSPLSYFPLARALDGLSLTILDQRALLEDRPTLRTIVEAATAFVDALITSAPREPYFLVGHSYGGSIAFEMARQLQTRGHAVSLSMIDSPFYGTVAEEGAAVSVGYFVPEALADAIRENLPDDASMLAVLTAAAKASITRDLGASASNATGIDEMATLYARQMMLYQSYRPSGVLAGDVQLLLASGSVLGGPNLPRTLKHFGQYIGGSIEVVSVAGGHLSLLKRENVASVAAVLRARAETVFRTSG